MFKKFLITLYDIFPHYKGVSYQISYLPYFNDEFIGTHLDTNYVFTYFGKYEYLIWMYKNVIHRKSLKE